jgi:3-phenylpropionate/trans-cinnamate dioxygenase ferredoxin component
VSASNGVVVGRFDDLAPNTAQKFDVAGTSVAVVRIGDDLYAIGDTCSHADVSLSEGEVLCDSLEIECWKHGSAFSLETGEPQTLPATQPVAVYGVRNVGGDIVVTLQSPSDSPSDSPSGSSNESSKGTGA